MFLKDVKRKPIIMALLLLLICLLSLNNREVYASSDTSEDPLKTVNTLTIKNITSQNTPLKGFKYEVLKEGSSDVIYVDMTEQNEVSLNLQDGVYTVRETLFPSEYKKSEDVVITFPYTDKAGNTTNNLTFEPKHIPAELTTPPDDNHYGPTGYNSSVILTVAGLATAIALLYVVSGRKAVRK